MNGERREFAVPRASRHAMIDALTTGAPAADPGDESAPADACPARHPRTCAPCFCFAGHPLPHVADNGGPWGLGDHSAPPAGAWIRDAADELAALIPERLARACELLLAERERRGPGSTCADCDTLSARLIAAETERDARPTIEAYRAAEGELATLRARVAELVAERDRWKACAGAYLDLADRPRATLGAPSALDRAVAEVCALDVADDDALAVTDTQGALDTIDYVRVSGAPRFDAPRDRLKHIAAVALAGMLACVSPSDATKEPGQ